MKSRSTFSIRRALIRIVTVFIVLAMALTSAGFDSAFAASGQDIDARAKQILKGMSRDEKIAQLMMVGVPAKGAVKLQEKYQFGGYILFAKDFSGSTQKSFRRKVKLWQKASDINMLIAVDEEGGTVVRASLYRQFRRKRFKSPRQVYNSGGYDGITADTKKKDRFLRDLGINCNLAPVADVPYSSSDFIYSRAFSTSMKRTKKFVKLTVSRMDRDNMVSALKHFPGYGGNGDTHGNLIRDRRALSTFQKRDLKPFATGISNGADMVMASHVIVNAWDRKRPASLSPAVHKYLRNEMGFDGVIITDGLAMAGICDFVDGDEGEAAVRAVKAGNDMLCVTGDHQTVFKALKRAVKSGRISRKQLDRAALRIIKMKIRRGIVK